VSCCGSIKLFLIIDQFTQQVIPWDCHTCHVISLCYLSIYLFTSTCARLPQNRLWSKNNFLIPFHESVLCLCNENVTMCNLELSRWLCIIKFSKATSHVKWLNGKVLQYPEDEDGDGLRNVGFFTIQPFDAAGSPRRFYYKNETRQPYCIRMLLELLCGIR
jgi:hypothetical protein